MQQQLSHHVHTVEVGLHELYCEYKSSQKSRILLVNTAISHLRCKET